LEHVVVHSTVEGLEKGKLLEKKEKKDEAHKGQ
jgi:hypothetical protein